MKRGPYKKRCFRKLHSVHSLLISTMQLVKFVLILCLALAVSAKKENHEHHGHGNLKIWYLYSEVFAPSCRFKCEDSKSFQLLVEESEDCPNSGSPKDLMANAIKPNQFCGAEVIHSSYSIN